MIPPKPASRPGKVSLWRYWKLFRKDILSAQPERLYRAWMAEFRTPFFWSFAVNQPSLVRYVLDRSHDLFPKSERVTAGLRPLLGESVFVSNGNQWAHQRRLIDPAFERGRMNVSLPAMQAAADAMVARQSEGRVDVEELASAATADVIFRTLFSVPIEETVASQTYQAFRAFQRAQPVATLSALSPRLPPLHSKRTRQAARALRRLIAELVARRRDEIANASAPDDLATRILTQTDPETGTGFSLSEMEDQVAIFFLAGHETSAALLGWTLWCLAASPDWADRVAEEGRAYHIDRTTQSLSHMPVTRNVLRETLRLYPPVPMMVREASQAQVFRERDVPKGAQIVISPWHMHRHERIWKNPDEFDPARWEGDAERQARRDAYIPFSAGPRVCPGAGFAMAEASLLLSAFMAHFSCKTLEAPVPVAHLTVRSENGIWLEISRRAEHPETAGPLQAQIS